MRLQAYGAVAEKRTRLARDQSRHTSYVGATSPNLSLGNPTCKYGFMSLAGRSAQGGIRLAKLQTDTEQNLPKACIRQMFKVRTLDCIHRVHTLDGRRPMDVQLHLPPYARSLSLSKL